MIKSKKGKRRGVWLEEKKEEEKGKTRHWSCQLVSRILKNLKLKLKPPLFAVFTWTQLSHITHLTLLRRPSPHSTIHGIAENALRKAHAIQARLSAQAE